MKPQGQLAIRSYPLSFSLSRNRALPNKNVTNSGAKSFLVNTVWWRQDTFPIHRELRKAHWLAVTRKKSARVVGRLWDETISHAHTETRRNQIDASAFRRKGEKAAGLSVEKNRETIVTRQSKREGSNRRLREGKRSLREKERKMNRESVGWMKKT